MIKKIKEIIKMFKGVKFLVILKCAKCGSLNIRLIDETLKESEYEIEAIHKTISHVEYAVRCNDCKAMGVIKEGW